jgi:hypothetical protein
MRRVIGDFEGWWDRDPQPGEFMIRASTVSKAKPMCLPEPGNPAITIQYFCMVLPSGQRCSIPLRPVPQADMPINGGHSWQWDGNEDKPTLTPSVNVVDHWHGWVKAGRLESC